MPQSFVHLQKLNALVRLYIIRATTAAASGHPTSSLSTVELLTTLFFGKVFRTDLRRPQNPNNDRFVLSKGHAAPLLYALYAVAGVLTEKQLLMLRKRTSMLQGHPMPDFPYTEVPTGSLGQGLSVAVGIALSARMQGLSFRTYVLLGDGELAEGSNWEAMQLAAHERLGNLVGILDVNSLGQSGRTMLKWNVKTYSDRIRSFGWHTIIVNGHDPEQILRAYAAANKVHGKPTMIIAKTIKGHGISFLENKNGWHGRPLTQKECARAEQELLPVDHSVHGIIAKPLQRKPHRFLPQKITSPIYSKNIPVATRKALAAALVRLAPAFPHMVVLDGDVRNSTYTDAFEKKFPQQFIEAYIAEQNMAGIASGLASRGMLPVTATFAAFWTRAYDQLRMAQYAGTHQVFIGTHAGVSIGHDGASQMGLEDIALFRTLEQSTVLYPSDAYAAEKLMHLALKAHGIVYIRATRAATPVLYARSTQFVLGGSHTLRSSTKDVATVVAAGITLYEAITAADELATQGINVRVIDLYSIKPLDITTLRKAARQTARLIVVEDHRQEGGIAEAVRTALDRDGGSVLSLAVHGIPHSGTAAELLHAHAIDAAAIIRSVKKSLYH